MADCDWEGRWAAVDRLLTRTGPLAQPGFEPSPEVRQFVQEVCQVLVIGAGGLGCELLKDLALCGFRNIHVIDMDTIDVSNLNRQFLFRPGDVGKSKAIVAAAFVNARVAGCNVTPHFCKIQDKDEEFYRQFHVVVCGLDSIVARRWINATLFSLVVIDEEGNVQPDTIVPMIDGGTEGFKGQARVIFPGMSSCFECSLDAFPPQVTYPMCTIANTPRLPQHCIEYAKIVLWPKEFKDTPLDGDDPQHIQWLFERSSERAAQYGIAGVTYRLTQGVVKNIIPAVASTNAVIAAACANECLKIATSSHPYLNNYMMFNGLDGLYTYTFEYERKPDCLVCGGSVVRFECDPEHTTVEQMIERLAADRRFQMKAPGIRFERSTIYMAAPESIERATRKNLPQTLSSLGIEAGAVLTVTDAAIPRPISLQIVRPQA